MLPTSLLLLTSTLLIPHVTATPALCNPSNHGYPVPTINQKAADFCQKLDAENFKSKSVVYGIPLMQLSYTQLNGKEACKLDGCVESMETLVMSCKYPRFHSIKNLRGGEILFSFPPSFSVVLSKPTDHINMV
jgi:hypothetical protein